MEKGRTYMNSFLFNISLVLLGSMAITQFVTDCLSDYVAFTDVDALFNTLIKNLKFFKYFYRNHVFQYVLFAIFVLSLFYMIIQLNKAQESIRDKSLINLEKEKNKKKEKKEKKQKIEEKVKSDRKKKEKSNKDKDTESGGSSDKINSGKKNKQNTSEEKLDGDDDNENNINNEPNSYEYEVV